MVHSSLFYPNSSSTNFFRERGMHRFWSSVLQQHFWFSLDRSLDLGQDTEQSPQGALEIMLGPLYIIPAVWLRDTKVDRGHCLFCVSTLNCPNGRSFTVWRSCTPATLSSAKLSLTIANSMNFKIKIFLPIDPQFSFWFWRSPKPFKSIFNDLHSDRQLEDMTRCRVSLDASYQ